MSHKRGGNVYRITLITILIIAVSFPVFSLVTNTAAPVKGKWDFQMQKIWEIEDAGDDVFGEVQNIQAARDGKIYIADSKNNKIYIIDKDGKFVSRFGKRGEGPGEIRHYSMGEQLFVVGNSVIFADRGMLHYYGMDGKFKKDIRFSNRLKPRTFISEDVFISAPVTTFRLGSKKGEIKLYNVNDKSEKVIAEFLPFKKASATKSSEGRQATIVMIFGGITPLMTIGQRDGNIFYGMSNSYHISKVNTNGKGKIDFAVEGKEPKPITNKVKNELFNGMGDIPQDMADKIKKGLPDKASFFSFITIDKNGFVYVYLSDPVPSPKQEIDIFSPEGKYLYSAVISVGEGRTLSNVFFHDETLIIASEDEEGNIHLAKYTIKLPG